MNPIIAEKLRDFDIALYAPIRERELDLGEPLAPRAGNLVKVITGMRRSGKSYRLFQEMEKLHAQGVPWSRMCYFNFEDDRLSPVTPAIGDEMLEAFEAINPGATQEGFYLFLDEVQEMASWGKWLRRIVDSRRVTIYATGSSSQMLASEISTEFRGRAIDFELLPLSFSEYLAFNESKIDVSQPAFSASDRIALERAFRSYIQEGGFPAVQGMPNHQAVPLLQSYAQQVVLRDVIERHNIGNAQAITLFAQRLLSMNAQQLSLRKIESDLKSAGHKVSRVHLSAALGYLQEAYLAFTVRGRKYSLSETSNAMAKVYAVDPGLALANARANTNNAGQRLEEVVFLELRRRAIGLRREAITSLRTNEHGYEIDFSVGDALDEASLQLIQVCENVENPATLKRELRALWEALDEQNLDEGTLIVGEGIETQYEQNGKMIRQIPAWKWCLSSL